MRSFSAAILDVVANPRVVLFTVDTSLLGSMSWEEMLKGAIQIARVTTNRPAVIIIDDMRTAPRERPCPLVLLFL